MQTVTVIPLIRSTLHKQFCETGSYGVAWLCGTDFWEHFMDEAVPVKTVKFADMSENDFAMSMRGPTMGGVPVIVCPLTEAKKAFLLGPDAKVLKTISLED